MSMYPVEIMYRSAERAKPGISINLRKAFFKLTDMGRRWDPVHLANF